MNREKEEYFRDLEEVLQSLKKQIQIEEERNAKVNRSKLITIRLNRMILNHKDNLILIRYLFIQWSKIAKDEGLGSIVFNQENVESSTASSKDIMEDDRSK